jgi:Uma2 family endonuclease
MSASIKPLSLDEFLAWERAQPLRYEFDGIQPIAMTGPSTAHERLVGRLIVASGRRLTPPCEVFPSGLKLIGENRVRYPDVTIACNAADETGDTVSPTIVFEILSPSSILTDRRVKAVEYRAIASVQVYVISSQEKPEITVMRRSTAWTEEILAGLDAILTLPEVGIEIPLQELYR